MGRGDSCSAAFPWQWPAPWRCWPWVASPTRPPAAEVPAGDAAFATTLQERLLDAKPGDVIEIPAGRHAFDRSLTLRASGVTIRGAGMDKSVLSF